MKKIKRKIRVSTICFMIFDSFVDFLFCVRLLHDLKNQPYDEYKIKDIKVLLQFLASSFDNSPFEYYNLNNEEYLWPFYLSLKKKNNNIFQGIILIYSFLFNHLIYPILYNIFGYKHKLNRCFTKVNKRIIQYIENNFGYEYLRDYKRYWSDDKEYYKQIRFKVFFEETLINLCNFWDKVITKNNRQSKLFINTDPLFFDIERYF